MRDKVLRADALDAVRITRWLWVEADAAWATQHDDELRALAAALLDHAEHLADLSDGDEDVTDWLAELHEQHHHSTRPDSYLTTIRLTADALADAIPAAGIPGPAAEALRGWQALAELRCRGRAVRQRRVRQRPR